MFKGCSSIVQGVFHVFSKGVQGVFKGCSKVVQVCSWVFKGVQLFRHTQTDTHTDLGPSDPGTGEGEGDS